MQVWGRWLETSHLAPSGGEETAQHQRSNSRLTTDIALPLSKFLQAYLGNITHLRLSPYI